MLKYNRELFKVIPVMIVDNLHHNLDLFHSVMWVQQPYLRLEDPSLLYIINMVTIQRINLCEGIALLHTPSQR